MSTEAQIGIRLKEAREYIGMSQELAAQNLGIARASLSAIENGKRKLTASELAQISQLYGVRPEVVLGEVPLPAEDPTTMSILRTSKELGPGDREQLLRFAEFLRNAGAPRQDSGKE